MECVMKVILEINSLNILNPKQLFQNEEIIANKVLA